MENIVVEDKNSLVIYKISCFHGNKHFFNNYKNIALPFIKQRQNNEYSPFLV